MFVCYFLWWTDICCFTQAGEGPQGGSGDAALASGETVISTSGVIGDAAGQSPNSVQVSSQESAYSLQVSWFYGASKALFFQIYNCCFTEIMFTDECLIWV